MIYNGKKGGSVLIQPLPRNKLSSLIKNTPNRDSVKTILVPGELVIPRRHVSKVSKYLRSKKIKFGNFK